MSDDTNPLDADTVMAAVTVSWHAVLDAEPFDPDRRLIDTGADSLRVMQFVLRLEQALGRKISYDVISPEMTPRALAKSLRDIAARPAVLPRVFYLSGLAGTDYRMVSQLRASLGDQIVVSHIDAPGLGEPPALVCDMVATAAWIAARIHAIQPDGPVRLAGYSVGGFQAFEVARQLIGSGREVASLCLFDPSPRRRFARIIGDTLLRPDWVKGKLRNPISRIGHIEPQRARQGQLVALALRYGAYGTAARLVRLRRRGDGSVDDDEPALFKLWQRRLLAVKRWRPEPLVINALLVVTDDGVRFGAARYWRQWIDGLTVFAVTGTHDALSKTPISDDLRAVFLAHIHRVGIGRELATLPSRG